MSARPAETAAWQAQQDAAAEVAGQCAAPVSLHSAEMAAAHAGRPSPEAAVAAGVTPASGDGGAS